MADVERIATSFCSFEGLIKKYTYVDNTDMLWRLVSDSTDCMFFISRPRRFGKSLMHDFYIRLKNSSGDIRFMMMTGVTKLTKLSVFSGLNNPEDLTMDHPEYAGLLGYTPKEIETTYPKRLDALAKKLKTDSARRATPTNTRAKGGPSRSMASTSARRSATSTSRCSRDCKVSWRQLMRRTSAR